MIKKGKVSINDDKYNVNIDYNELNEYRYQEDENTKVIYNKKTNTLIRNSNDLYMKYTFDLSKKTPGKILIKELNQEVKVMIKTTKLIEEDNNIEIKYQVEDDYFTYKIEME